jgi:hypothetical protein
MGRLAEARKQECAISEVVHGENRRDRLVDQVLKPTREGTAAVGWVVAVGIHVAQGRAPLLIPFSTHGLVAVLPNSPFIQPGADIVQRVNHGYSLTSFMLFKLADPSPCRCPKGTAWVSYVEHS